MYGCAASVRSLPRVPIGWRPETRNIINVDDDEQDEEEDERDEGGEGEEGQEEEEGEGERRFCLGQEHDSRAVREREGSEWPPDF